MLLIFSCFNFQVRVFTAVISALLIIEYMSFKCISCYVIKYFGGKIDRNT